MGQASAPGPAGTLARLGQRGAMEVFWPIAARAENPAGSFSVPPQSSRREVPVSFILSNFAFAAEKASRKARTGAPLFVYYWNYCGVVIDLAHFSRTFRHRA
jgi:hypothetical protein